MINDSGIMIRLRNEGHCGCIRSIMRKAKIIDNRKGEVSFVYEHLWYTVAATLAGIGTGLVGLSAATAMVPILIVLCPSFAGETGAYQATAIALASDILGSAVTTATYAKHKNIDLRRGWIMLACIVSMCTIGSFVAWKAGNVVLGGFTLFLTLCIGNRFLIKPTTERKNGAAKGEKLDIKGVAVSLFFGLTIGFGTGFVGTGGGMMMLVVFTAFLGMEQKNRRRHQHFHHDVHHADRFCQPYTDPSGYSVGTLAGIGLLYGSGYGNLSNHRKICQSGQQPHRRTCDRRYPHLHGCGTNRSSLLGTDQ